MAEPKIREVWVSINRNDNLAVCWTASGNIITYDTEESAIRDNPTSEAMSFNLYDGEFSSEFMDEHYYGNI